jgi:hypothetical protein
MLPFQVQSGCALNANIAIEIELAGKRLLTEQAVTGGVCSVHWLNAARQQAQCAAGLSSGCLILCFSFISEQDHAHASVSLTATQHLPHGYVHYK